MKHATSRTLYDYWSAVRGTRAGAARGHLVPRRAVPLPRVARVLVGEAAEQHRARADEVVAHRMVVARRRSRCRVLHPVDAVPDPRVAERFEVYACGVELANGFGELTDAAEQRQRFSAAMDEKQRRYGEEKLHYRLQAHQGFLS